MSHEMKQRDTNLVKHQSLGVSSECREDAA